MSQVTALGYAGFRSPSWSTWADLGPRVFAMGLAESSDDAVRLRLDDRHHRIAMLPGDRDEVAYLGWEVASPRDFDEIVRALGAEGFNVEFGSDAELDDRRVDRMAYFNDPGGLRFEVFCGALEQHRSFHPSRPFSGFVTEGQGLGHIVIVVPDEQQEHEFLTETLGFQLRDFLRNPRTCEYAYFYGLNTRHHSLGVVGRAGLRGVHHLMVQVRDLDDVGIAYDLAQQDDALAISMTLGRHATDRMVSFYVDTPTGLRIEYGWGSPGVENDTSVVTEAQTPAEVWGHKQVGEWLPSTVQSIEADRSAMEQQA